MTIDVFLFIVEIVSASIPPDTAQIVTIALAVLLTARIEQRRRVKKRHNTFSN